jgi:hypothetical protein
MTGLSWEHWVKLYAEKGHQVIARSWPGMEGDFEELRRNPSDIATLGLADVVHHYERIMASRLVQGARPFRDDTDAVKSDESVDPIRVSRRQTPNFIKCRPAKA